MPDVVGSLKHLDDAVQKFFVARGVFYGHSLITGFGAEDSDRDVITRMASSLGMREVNRAVNGAALMYHQSIAAPSGGGFAKVLQDETRKTRGNSTLTVTSIATATSITVASGAQFAVGQRIHIGSGDTGASGGEIAFITAIVTNVLTVLPVSGASGGLLRGHASGQPVYVVPAAYVSNNPFYLFRYGINDLRLVPEIVGAAETFRGRYKQSLELVIARARCSDVFEHTHSSNVFTGAWTQDNATITMNSGVGFNRADAASTSVWTIHVPDNFPGGTVALGFINGQHGPANMATFNLTVDGVSAGTHVCYTTVAGGIRGSVKRLTGLSAGRHIITATLAAGSTVQVAYADWWGIEAPEPPICIVSGENRPRDYAYATVAPIGRRSTTLSGVHGIGSTTINTAVTGTTGFVVGSMVTFEEGTANEESREILTIVDTDTFTVAATSISHASGSALAWGVTEGSIRELNELIEEVVTGFGTSAVSFVNPDATIAKNPAYFVSDGLHYSDAGSGELAKLYREAFLASPALRTSRLTHTSVPTAPLPGSSIFAASYTSVVTATSDGWVNMPSALTELFGTANHRRLEDLRRGAEARFIVGVQVAGVAASFLTVRFFTSTDATLRYLFLNPEYAEETAARAVLTSIGMKDSGWRAINPLAIAEAVTLSVWGSGGNASVDPVFNAYLAWR